MPIPCRYLPMLPSIPGASSMRKLFLTMFVLGTTISTIAVAQTPDSLIAELKAINAAVAGPMPGANKHLLLSERALNIFLSEAAGYYLSDPDDLTLYKNSVVANSAEGTLAIYHNTRQPMGPDSSIRRFFSFGAQVNAADAFNAASAARRYNNQFGALIKHSWIGRPRVTATSGQVKIMDALRANLLHSLEATIRKKAAEEEAALDAIDSAKEIPGQDAAAAKDIARKQFNSTLQQEMEFEWAHTQAAILAQSFNYRVISFDWTSISCYLPLITENFQTASSPGGAPSTRHAWPLHVNATHTRLWEGSRFGRLFITLAGDLDWNNSRDSYALLRAGDAWLGDYHSFLTPDLRVRAIYFPANSHIGISFLAKRSMGDYPRTDATLGLPVVLINKKAEPAVNFEFQLRFYDLGHSIAPGTGFSGHTAVGLTAGIPFSKIAY